ncbi:uncharacterized protein IWZ02DRAFT_483322 [Phyllosticta citriasiana]|uniref:uncharacterized protein n=1 Tax=Phyllosticta citriasiana TaxID=595635 RepID=UPI0030FD87E1
MCEAPSVRYLYEEERKYRHPQPRGFPALMSVNKLIYKETIGVLYGNPPPGSSPIIQLEVGNDHIQIRGYNIFCEKHHVFDKVAEGIFTCFPCVELNVHAFCDAWPEPDEKLEDIDTEPDIELQLSRQRSLKNNLRWVASQLSKVKSLSSLVLNQVDAEFYEFYDKAEFGSIELCSYLGCSCFLVDLDEDEETIEDAFATFSTDIITRMTSKQTVEEELEIFKSYDGFMHRLKKCELTGTKVDTTELLRKAQHSRENEHPDCLNSVMNRFALAFRAEISQKLALRDEIESFVKSTGAGRHLSDPVPESQDIPEHGLLFPSPFLSTCFPDLKGQGPCIDDTDSSSIS